MSVQKQLVKSKNAYKVTFSVPVKAVKDAEEVLLLGEFNHWEPSEGIPMKLAKDKFTATMELDSGREYQFRYLINKETWANDGEADKYVPTPLGVENSVVVIPAIVEN